MEIKNEAPFYNNWISLDTIPQATEADFIPVESEYLYVRLSSVLLVAIVSGLGVATFILFSSFTWAQKLYILAGFLVLILLWAWLVYMEFKCRGYAIRDQDIAYRSGYIFRRRQYIPFRRVQHCKITEGLIERLFNFSTVVISAAGDDIVIHGLRPDDAQNLQQFINEKVDSLTKEMHYGER